MRQAADMGTENQKATSYLWDLSKLFFMLLDFLLQVQGPYLR